MDGDLPKQKVVVLSNHELCQEQAVGNEEKKRKIDDDKCIALEARCKSHSSKNNVSSFISLTIPDRCVLINNTSFSLKVEDGNFHLRFAPNSPGSDSNSTIPLEDSEREHELMEIEIIESPEVGSNRNVEIEDEGPPTLTAFLDIAQDINSNLVNEPGVFAFVEFNCKPKSGPKS